MFIFSCSHRLNLHSTLQFSSLTPCDSSPLHDSPRATSLTIRSSHLASEDPPRSRSHSNNLPALPIVVLASFLKVLYTHCFSPTPHLTPMKRRKDIICILLRASTFLLRRLLDLISEDSLSIRIPSCLRRRAFDMDRIREHLARNPTVIPRAFPRRRRHL